MKSKITMLNMPVDVTENYVRIRVKNPGEFKDESFRTVTISEKEGIKSVQGKLKDGDGSMVPQNFMFDKDKWSEAEAKKWIHDHNYTIANDTVTQKNKMGFFESVKVFTNAFGSGEITDRPKRYTSKFMAPGLTNYPDENKKDALWWLPRKVMDDMQKSFIGCPVVFQKDHIDSSTPDKFEKVAGGVVTEVWTDPKDGWDYCAFIIWNDQLKDLIEKRGFNVSCAYDTLDYTEGGVLNAIKFDHEVSKAEYIHLAIVEAPRQTGAQIFLNNIDNKNPSVILLSAMWKGEKVMLKLFPRGKTMKNEGETEEQKKAREAEEAKKSEEAKKAEAARKNEMDNVDAEKAVLEDPDGKEIPLKELIATWEAEQAEIKKKEELMKNGKKVLTMEDEYKGVKVSDMYNAYKHKMESEAKAKKNADEEAKKKMEEEEKAKKNADEEAKKKAEAEEAEKKKHFNALNAARQANGQEQFKPMPSKSDRIEAAKSQY